MERDTGTGPGEVAGVDFLDLTNSHLPSLDGVELPEERK